MSYSRDWHFVEFDFSKCGDVATNLRKILPGIKPSDWYHVQEKGQLRLGFRRLEDMRQFEAKGGPAALIIISAVGARNG